MVSSWGFNFRNSRKALIRSLQLTQKLNGSPHEKCPLPAPCSEVCWRLNVNQSSHKLACYLLASRRVYLNHSLKENCLHKVNESLKPYGGQPKETDILSGSFKMFLLETQFYSHGQGTQSYYYFLH